MSAAAQAFGSIYGVNHWGFGSGHGSLPAATKGYRDFLQRFIRANQVSSVLDFGCGDWQFSRLMDWSNVDYLGLDVHPALIDLNRRKYGQRTIRFDVSPRSFSDVPQAELLIAKDVLQHFSADMVREFMSVVVPRFRYALITNCATPADQVNKEIKVGEFRPLDLRLAPFNFPAPAVYSFKVPAKISFRLRKRFPASTKVVLLYSSASQGSH